MFWQYQVNEYHWRRELFKLFLQIKVILYSKRTNKFVQNAMNDSSFMFVLESFTLLHATETKLGNCFDINLNGVHKCCLVRKLSHK